MCMYGPRAAGRGGVASGCTLVLLRGDLKGDAGISARSTSACCATRTRITRWDKHELGMFCDQRGNFSTVEDSALAEF